MALTAAQLVANVSVQGVDSAKQQLQGMSQIVNQTSSGFKAMLGNALNFAATQAFNLVGQAINFLKDQTVDAVKLAMQHQDVMAQTVQTLKSTKDASGLSANALSNLALSLSQVTTFGNDTIQSGENMLLTFTNIGQGVFPQATKAMLNMSQTMGTDLKGSAIELGKALNDPLKGISALSRVGVTFSDQQKELIKNYIAHGDIAKAQGVILSELNKEFGGTAEAAGKTFGGQLAILNNRFDNLKQKIGSAILPVLSDLLQGFSSKAGPILDKFGQWFTNVGGPALQSFGAYIEKDVAPKLEKIGENVGRFFSSFNSPELGKLAQTIGKDLFNAFNNLLNVLSSKQFGDFVALIGKDLSKAINIALPIVEEIAKNIFQFAQDIASRVQPIIQRFMNWWAQAWPGLSIFVSGVFDVIKGIIQIAWAIITDIFKTALDLISGNWQGVWNDFKTMLSGVWDGIKSIVQGGLKELEGFILAIAPSLQNAITAPFQGAFNAIGGFFDSIRNTIGSLANDLGSSLSGSSVPHHASGTDFAPGGLSVVGERGPELVYMPRGATVVPFNATRSFLNGASSSNISDNRPLILQIDGHTIAMTILPYVVDAIRHNVGVWDM